MLRFTQLQNLGLQKGRITFKDHDYFPLSSIFDEPIQSSDALKDHDYMKSSSKIECANCTEKDKHIQQVEMKLEKLCDELKQQKTKSKKENTRFGISRIVLMKSDETVNQYTGINSK